MNIFRTFNYESSEKQTNLIDLYNTERYKLNTSDIISMMNPDLRFKNVTVISVTMDKTSYSNVKHLPIDQINQCLFIEKKTADFLYILKLPYPVDTNNQKWGTFTKNFKSFLGSNTIQDSEKKYAELVKSIEGENYIDNIELYKYKLVESENAKQFNIDQISMKFDEVGVSDVNIEIENFATLSGSPVYYFATQSIPLIEPYSIYELKPVSSVHSAYHGLTDEGKIYKIYPYVDSDHLFKICGSVIEWNSVYKHLITKLYTSVINAETLSDCHFENMSGIPEYEWSLISSNLNIIRFRNLERKLITNLVNASGIQDDIKGDQLCYYNHCKKKLVEESKLTENIYLSIQHSIENQKSIRVVISDLDDIKMVLSDINNLSKCNKIDYDIKTKLYSTKKYKLDLFGSIGLRCRISDEYSHQLGLSSAVSIILENTNQLHYRLINRMKIELSDTVSVDMSVVKQTNKPSDLLNKDEEYEVEMEFKVDSYSNILHFPVDELAGHLSKLECDNLIDTEVKSMVAWDFYQLFRNDPNLDPEQLKKYKSHYDEKKYANNIITKWFQNTPNLNNLTNIRDFMTTVVNIELEHVTRIFNTKDYCFTEKTDGLRMYLYINSIGEAMFIDQNFQIYPTHVRIHNLGSNLKIYNCLLDGEYLSKNEKHLFFIFDCLFLNNINLMNNPLLTFDKSTNTRLGYSNGEFDIFEIVNVINDNFKCIYTELRFKEFTQVNETNLEKLKTIANKTREASEYPIDGVIFTMYTCNYYQAIIGGEFYDTFSIKWKPAEKLTADYYVEIQKDQYLNHIIKQSKNEKYKILNLKTRLYNKLINRCTIEWPIDYNNLLHCYNEETGENDGEIFYDTSVVEFKYDPANNTWIPVKLRPDKTVNKIPNSDQNVTAILRTFDKFSIHQLTDEFKKGLDLKNIDHSPHIKYSDPNNAEYSFFTENDKIVKMFKAVDHPYNMFIGFTHMVKYNVIRKIIKNATSKLGPINYFDIGCGRINDWEIWLNLVNFYGIDLDQYNIDDIKKFKQKYPYTEHLKKFKIDAQQFDILEYNPENSLKNIPKSNIISCQFVIHFLCQNSDKFNKFVSLVNDKLADGGILVMSTFDGSFIDQCLKNDIIIGVDHNNNLVWRYVKMYDKFQDFGNLIKSTIVPLRGFQFYDEYLVNIKKVVTRLSENGINLVRNMKFSELINQDQVTYYNSRHTTKKIHKIVEYDKLKDISKIKYIDFLIESHVMLIFKKGERSFDFDKMLNDNLQTPPPVQSPSQDQDQAPVPKPKKVSWIKKQNS